MKKLLYLFMLLLCCACTEDKSVDPTLMPPATTTGENTLGCLVDGWVYASGRYGKPQITLHKDGTDRYFRIETKCGIFFSLTFLVVNPSQGEDCDFTEVNFNGEEIEGGKVHVTRMDGKVFSGTFAGGTITEGRFDLNYRDK